MVCNVTSQIEVAKLRRPRTKEANIQVVSFRLQSISVPLSNVTKCTRSMVVLIQCQQTSSMTFNTFVMDVVTERDI